MKKILSIIGLLLSFYVSSQITYDTYCFSNNGSTMMQASGITNTTTYYDSKNGATFPTNGIYRALTIAVNIIYDQTPTANPAPSTTDAWGYITTEGINNNSPNYLLNFFDVNNITPYNGCLTKFYAESSFNQLIMLSDFIVVNIKQSRITSNNSTGMFSKYTLMDAVINYINQNGGLQTLYNHNSLSDYDFTTTASFGIQKPYIQDNRIDIVNFLLRNTKTNYGDLNAGSGNSYITPTQQIKIYNNTYVGYNTGTCQCVGSGNITVWGKNIFTHEYAHFFLGGNEFHTSGGTTANDSYHNTFIGLQWGYGLFNGGLTSCNGYERWRLGWYGSTNSNYQIASNNENSDILSKFTGEKTFTLRDFVTYGDVIRIKLPYKDSEYASNQYIWLENHQSGKNGKFDEPMYNQSGTCRDVAKVGIYSYYQVGKDIIESTDPSKVFPTTEKDNLRIISAEGNYNVNFLGNYEDCLGWSGGSGRPRFEYTTPNTFNGVNPETEIWAPDYNSSTLVFPSMHSFMGSKKKDGIIYNNIPWLGDGNFSAFIPTLSGKVMDISSNPSAINTTTCYSTRNSGVMNVITTNRNTRKLYLTGLSIKMIDSDPSNTEMKAYTVKVRWDDYDIKQNVNWTGDIVLNEQLNLLQGKTLTLEQNKTPNQIDKDPVSNYFAKTTFLTCESNSICNLATNSVVLVKEKSSLVLNGSSTLSVQNSGIITIESGSTLQIKAGANLNLLGSAKIVIKSGGYICVESGANINLQDYTSLIVLEEGAIYGANPALFSSPSCSSTITKTGNGAIVDYNQDVYIQNEAISTNRYIGGKNIFVGNHVTTTKSFGDVFVNNSANVIFDCKEITFDTGFECTNGSTYEVKNH
jgi:hypothetical protein